MKNQINTVMKTTKQILICLVVLFSSIIYSQDMKIKWEDYDGREFSIKCISGEFSYSMVAGDQIQYYPSYSNNAGKVQRIGNVNIEYYPSYSNNAGKVQRVGRVSIEYFPSYSNNAGNIKRVGNLTVEYFPSYSNNAGKVKGTRGSVN